MKHQVQILPLALAFLLCIAPMARGQWVKTNIPKGTSVRSIAVNGSNVVATTYAGTYFSTDNGLTWSSVSASVLAGLNCILVADNGDLVAGTSYSGGCGGPGGGQLFFSTDQGASWNESKADYMNDGVNSLILVGTKMFAGTDFGIYYSTDFGKNWTIDTSGLPHDAFISTLGVCGKNVLAATSRGIYRSTDEGRSWKPASADSMSIESVSALTSTGGNTYGLAYDYALGGRCVMRSTDDGSTWTNAGAGLSAYALLAYSSDLFIGTQSGVLRSTDNGSHWAAINTGLSDTVVYALARSGSNLLAGTERGGICRISLPSFGTLSVAIPRASFLATYPNPFTKSTTIRFTSAQSGAVQVSVFNLLGQEISRLYSGELAAGEHSFTWDANGLPAGAYLCTLRQTTGVEKIPIRLVK